MTVKIYHIEYTIRLASREEIEKNVGGNKDADTKYFGCHIPYTQEILLDKSIKEDSKIATLIHEVTHAIIFLMGYGENTNEELFCDFMSAHFGVIENIVNEFKRRIGNEN